MTVDLHIQNQKMAALIAELGLEQHPEGGYYKRTYCSQHRVGVDKHEYGDASRPINSSIYYLLAGSDYSAWRCFKSSETWYHHQGSSITLHILDPVSKQYRSVVVGDPLQDAGAVFQYTVDKNTWFAASVNNPQSFAMCGCSVSPAFDYRDYQFCDATQLKKDYPGYDEIIDRYARDEPVVAMPSA